MCEMQFEKNSSIFWTWGSYVFLPINIVVGELIYQQGGGIMELCISLFLAFIIMMFLIYPPIVISVRNHVNYSQAINKYVKYRILSKFAIISLVLTNIGWYSIQTKLFVNIVEARFSSLLGTRVFFIFLFSILFASGVILLGYRWLNKFGKLSMLLLTALFLSNISFKSLDSSSNDIHLMNILSFTFQIVGVWVYSSVTCIMDIASHVKNENKAFMYILLAIFVADIMLIFLGYLLKDEIVVLTNSSIIFFIVTLIALWSTNSANFYSTMCSLKILNLQKIILLVPILCAMVTIGIIHNFEEYVIKWLAIMNWIGLPIGIFWWYSLFKEKRYDYSIGRN